MKKLSFDDMEKVQGGTCTGEIIGWAAAFSTYTYALSSYNERPTEENEAKLGGAAFALAAADEKWLSCMGWL